MTAFNEYDVVRLTRPLPEHRLDAGTRGAIVMVFAEQQPAEYEVEFVNPDGETIALLTLPEDILRRDDARPHEEGEAMNWDWIPGIRVGPFCFGAPLPRSRDVELALLDPDHEDADWQTYRVGDEEARVSVRDGVVTGVECVKSLLYLGRDELLGLSTKAVAALVGEVLVRAKDWSDGTVMYEAEDLGLTLWVEDERVESATVAAVEAHAD